MKSKSYENEEEKMTFLIFPLTHISIYTYTLTHRNSTQAKYIPIDVEENIRKLGLVRERERGEVKG